MSRTGKAIVGLIIGGLCGALIGATLLGVPTYLDTSSSILGTVRSWTGIVIIMGMIYGSIPGTIIGTIVGARDAGKNAAAIIGAAVTLPIAAYLFLESTIIDTEIRMIAALCLPAGAFIGIVVSILLHLKHEKHLP